MKAFCLSITSLLLLLGPSPAAMTNGLVHHWNFDEGPDWHDSPFQSACTNLLAFDHAGGASATLQNMSSTNWVSGRQFTALEFNGASQYIATATNLASTLGGSATFSCWFRTTQTGSVSSAFAPGICGTTGSTGLQWGRLDDQGRIALALNNVPVVQAPSPANDGRWHHLVISRDATSGTARLYLDGSEAANSSGPAGNLTAPFSSMGRIENALSNSYFRGRLDQVTLFNRVISGDEVSVLYTNHAPKSWDASSEGVNNRPFSTISVFAKSYDVEQAPLSIRSWTQPSHGTVVYNGDGSFTCTATTNYTGSDSFAVTIEDGMGGFHRSMMNVTVMNEPPGGGGVPVTQFKDFAAIQSNGTNMFHNGWRVPRVIDWNLDGKPDLLICAGGYVWLYTNTGTAQSPLFGTGVKVKAAGTDINVGTSSSSMALIDLSGDGVRDLVIADSSSKLRLYRNIASASQPPVFTNSTYIKSTNGTDFVLPDKRFDMSDYDGNGTPDLVTGSYSGSMLLHTNAGTIASPRFGPSQALFSDSYNIFPRLFDLNGNGLIDFLRGINWGDIRYWRDAGSAGLSSSVTLSITTTTNTTPDLHGLTDGPVVDFGDFNGDGILDLVIGGQSGGNLFLAYGVRKTIAESIAEIEAIYDAHPGDVGVALSADTNALLKVVNNANLNLISYLQNGTLGTRESVFSALTNHIAKYSFLKYQTLDTNYFHHVPSIVLQNWVMLEHCIADTPSRRLVIADVMGLTGTARTIFLESSLALGDNAKSIPAAYGTIRDLLRRHPREVFPDAVLTIDQLYGDNRGGFIWTPDSTKNTFGDWAVGLANEWAGDLTSAIEKVLGTKSASGDYFTFVMGHEVTHSLDGYVNSRANKDLKRRWGLMLCTAGGPEVVAGTNGWIDWTATQNKFQLDGLYDPSNQTWTVAWSNYWNVGDGEIFKDLSFMRFDISWFLSNSQESLATQANHHWANGPGRLIGAVDRFRRATTLGLPPLKANINEVVTFIDFISAGLNRVNLVETKTQSSPQQVNWFNHYADLERNDLGYITRISVDGFVYDFSINTNGVITNVQANIAVLNADKAMALSGQKQVIPASANDYMLDGRPVLFDSFSQPAHGTVTNIDGQLVYQSVPGYSGMDRFSYQVGLNYVTVDVQVVTSDAGIIASTWWNTSGSSVASLATSSRFPYAPDELTNYTTFELASNRGDSYGSQARALLVPAQTGDYMFWMASDDTGELWLSTNDLPSGKQLIASVPGYSSARQWNKFPEQQSAPIHLEANHAYYIEALFKENNGSDHMSVAWAGPGLAGTNVITASSLVIFGLPHPPSASVKSPKTSSVNVPGKVGLLVDGSASSIWTSSPVSGFWSQASGPAPASFLLTNAPATGVQFTTTGTYVLRFTAVDGTLQTTSDVTVNYGFVPSLWTNSSIGTLPATIKTDATNGIYNMTCAGAGIQSSGTDDDLYFVHQPAAGDVQITARIVSIQNVSGSSSRAGVMIREDTTRNAREVFMGVTSLSAGRFIWRSNSGATSGNTSITTLAQPCWVRLIRSNNVFFAASAPNVNNAPGPWTTQGFQTISMSNTIRIGMAAASGSASSTALAIIDNVTISPSPQNVGPLVTVTTNQTVTNGTLALPGRVSDDGNPNPPAQTTALWSQVNGPSTVFIPNPAITNAAATFFSPGNYTLRLVADDGQIATFSDQNITVTTPSPLPQVSAFTPVSGNSQFQFRLEHFSHTNCLLLVSTDLVSWQYLNEALHYSNGLFVLSDPSSTNNLKRFYRIQLP